MNHGIIGVTAFVISLIILFMGDFDHERTRDAYWGFVLTAVMYFISHKIQSQIKELGDKL